MPRCRRPNKSICLIDFSSQSVCDALRSIFQTIVEFFSHYVFFLPLEPGSRKGLRRFDTCCSLWSSSSSESICTSLHESLINHLNISLIRIYFGCKKFSKSILSMVFPLLLVPTTNNGGLLLFFMRLPPASRAPIYRNKQRKYWFPS